MKSYKTIHACSKAFYGNEGSDDHLRLKSIFLPYYLPYSSFDLYIAEIVREDFASRSYRCIDLGHFYSFCAEMAQKPYILKIREKSAFERALIDDMVKEESESYDPDFEQQINIIAKNLHCDVKKFERVYSDW